MYDPWSATWTTPDPLAHKYLGFSPYNYCGNDPVNFVDPDGRKIELGWKIQIFGQKDSKYETTYFTDSNFPNKVTEHLAILKGMDQSFTELIDKIESSETVYNITEGEKNSFNGLSDVLTYNADLIKTQITGERPPFVGLIHELGHTENHEDGTAIPITREEKKKAKAGDQQCRDKVNNNEKNSIEYENIARSYLGLPLRPEDYYTPIER